MSADLETKLESLKSRGNACFARKDWLGAVAAYTDGLELLLPLSGGAEELSPGLLELQVSLLSNRAMALLNLRMFREALLDSESVLGLRPEHEKSLFRKARSLQGLQRLSEAIQTTEDLLRLHPKNPAAAALLKTLRRSQPQQQNDAAGEEAREAETVEEEAAEKEDGPATLEEEDGTPPPDEPNHTDYPRPRTGFEFLRVYRELLSSPSQFGRYIQRIRPSKLPKFVAANLDSEFLCHLVKSIATLPPAAALPYLDSLTETPRFEMIAMFLDQAEKDIVQTAFRGLREEIQGAAASSPTAAADLETVLEKYDPPLDEEE